MSNSRSPNFPVGLNIHPSCSDFQSIQEVGSSFDLYGYAAQEKAIQQYGIAGRVWEAAYAINLYLNPPPSYLFDPPFLNAPDKRPEFTIIELGSGSGLVGSIISRSMTEKDILVLTDLPEVCSLLESNVKNSRRVDVRPLAWGNAEDAIKIARELLQGRSLTHVLCSDLVYFPELLAPLLRTIIQLSSPPFSCATDSVEVIVSYKVRSLLKETPFWSAFGLWFTFEPVLEQRVSLEGIKSHWRRFGADMEGPIFLFVAQRRPDSFGWTVPQNDHELLAGVGALGTPHPKESDTFESLLFMTFHGEESEERVESDST
ncbi:hypothetical protein E1B28_011095 [Marasmius oreades]|uniref:Uncharacterized protein n=1 Tax=Marasmius oreades TaxID=181124 RepID=A0A9P7RTW9_9AGAR|nr:uncharacterized protein E1B28_011095 [Marasmius oreades]KAG7089407.1 hypothetical protein E1B28_011095 [Marasmius oreades]